MVRIVINIPLDMTTPYIEGFCLEDDDKPTGVCTGSKMTEVDTGDTYLYDESSATWIKFPPAAEA